jgi:4-amino-4-deoxy-L-arabinose transferase-like glycosyltransferase
MLVSAGWWIAAVTLVPASMRPYVGGSQTNSIIELTLGYNGLGRLTGEQVGSVGGGPAGTGSRWGQTGLLRLVSSEIGGQIAWLLPAALLLLLTGLWLTRRAPRVDPTRAALVLWGGWVVVTALVFSLMKGIFHAYYTVALAPAVAALVGIGAALAWHQRDRLVARASLVLAAAATAGWAYALLARTPTWLPWLRPAVLVAGLAAALALAWTPYLRRQVAYAAALVAILVGLAAPAAASVQTALITHTGAIPTAGPAVAGARGGPVGGFEQRGGSGQRGGFGPGGRFDGGPRRGGLLDAAIPSSALVRALQANAGHYTWVAAAVGSNSAAGPQLASGRPVMAIGGFNGSDPTPTLAAFQAYVAAGEIHYFLAGGGHRGGFGMGSTGTAGQITSWVRSTYTATTIGGVTVYDLTTPATGS